MNYHHAYHAGHSADIFKHFTLYLLLEALTQKEKPLSYIETHAAYAYYDLNSSLSQTTQEYKQGIERLWLTQPTGKLKDFLEIIKQFNHAKKANDLRFYPGSAWFAHTLLRNDDKMYLADINKDAISHLKYTLTPPPIVALNHQDGYQALNAWLPPKPARGLVLIDPPYEKSDDWTQVIKACQLAYKRWSHGIYAIWYPIKSSYEIKKFYNALSQLSFTEILITEFFPSAADVAQRLNGSGMIIINPPWQFNAVLDRELKELLTILKIDKGASYKIHKSGVSF